LVLRAELWLLDHLDDDRLLRSSTYTLYAYGDDNKTRSAALTVVVKQPQTTYDFTIPVSPSGIGPNSLHHFHFLTSFSFFIRNGGLGL